MQLLRIAIILMPFLFKEKELNNKVKLNECLSPIERDVTPR